MNIRNCIIITVIIFIVSMTGCKEERDFSQPADLINNWADSIENLNYSKYSRIEASPRSERSFRKMYDDYYISGIRIIEVDPAEGVKTGKDHNDTVIEYRDVSFIANTVKRNTGQPMQSIRGEVKIIRYPEGKRAARGWMLSNRTIIRIDQ